MAPNIQSSTIEPEIAADITVDGSKQAKREFKAQIVWRNVAIMTGLHLAGLYGLYLCFTAAQWQTIVCAILLYIISGLGITAGAHRLWSHRAYKAKFPLRVVLTIFNTMAFQNSIYEWSRDHRVHHKYSETDADPHNANRGFFFAHCGWLLCRKHPDVLEKGKTVSCEDLLQDPLVRFQRKFYLPLVFVFCFLLPTVLPNYLWGESFFNAYFVCALLRYTWTLNMTWLVNSAAHFWGRRPYDKHISPAENAVTIIGAIGEGFHNYHHTFPWDYATSELGPKFNLTTCFIDTCAYLGWAYDLKTVSPQVIRQRKERTGDTKDKGPYGYYN
ncbi:acyl-CoA Delta-9 desaturase-like [Oppia nitens]|uniref:acyl-CoA Delta-9 desaturase-like n=1 Tax=Oppia nitens TaxID=1686743 RepID=UPI0023DA2045|nr:acyl-CoA Delta-9 desaturase-like [Oppia nitens]